MIACVNPQRHYHLDWGLLQQGDPATFIIVDNLGPHFRVESTVLRGAIVYDYNATRPPSDGYKEYADY